MYTTRKPPRPRERRTPPALTEIPPDALQWLSTLARIARRQATRSGPPKQ
jgi:hypothetical protein